MKAITLEQAAAVNETISHGLCAGLGRPAPGHLCIMAAVNLALGGEHSDKHECVADAVRDFGVGLNDKFWSTRAARADGMKCYALACLGSRGVIDENVFASKLAELTVRRIVPIALRNAAKRNPKHAARLESAAVKCETEGTPEAALEASNAAAVASRLADTHAAAAAASADAAAYSAAAAAYAAGTYAAGYGDASAAVAYAAAYDATPRDSFLRVAAQCGVDALRFVNAPGIELMDKVCSK